MADLNIGGNRVLARWLAKNGPNINSFVWRRLFRDIPVMTQTGKFLDVDDGFGFAGDVDGIIRAPGDPYYGEEEISFSESTGWSLRDFGRSANVDKVYDDRWADAELALLNAANLRKRQILSRELLIRFNMRMERYAQSIAQDATTTFASYTAAVAGAAQWDNYSSSSSDPADQAEIAIESIENATGLDLSTPEARAAQGVTLKVLMNAETARKTRRHPKVTDKVMYTDRIVNKGSMDHLRLVLGADEIIVGNTRLNSAEEGQTASVANLWTDSVLFFLDQAVVIPETPQTCLARFRDDSGADAMVEVESVSSKVDNLSVGLQCDLKAFASKGYLFTDVLS